jgi:hypothetical protein
MKSKINFQRIIIALIIFIIVSDFLTSSSKITKRKTYKRISKSGISYSKKTQRVPRIKIDNQVTDLVLDDESVEPMPETILMFMNQLKMQQIPIRTMADVNAQVAQNSNCNDFFGFSGAVHHDLKERVKDWVTSQESIILSKVSPFIDSFAEYLNHDTAVGDFYGHEILNENGDLSQFNCNSHVINPNDKFGLIGYSGVNFKCGLKTFSHLRLCVIFDRCGTISISADKNSLECVSHLAGYEGFLNNAKKYGLTSSFGVALTRKFPKSVKIRRIQNNDFKDENFVHVGNFYLQIEGRMPPLPDSLLIGNIPVKEVLQVYGGKINLSMAAGQEQSKQIMDLINNDIEDNLIDKILNLGLEFVITANGKVSFFLNKISYGVFPDILLDVKSFDIVISTGSGSTGLPFGIYARLGAEILDSQDTKIRLLNNFQSILKILGYEEQEFQQDEDLVGAIEISTSGIGIELSNTNYRYKCLIFFVKPFNFSCQFGNFNFTVSLGFVLELGRDIFWTVQKIDNFLAKTGTIIMRFKESLQSFAEKTAEALKQSAQTVSTKSKSFFDKFLGFFSKLKRSRKFKKRLYK